MTKKPNQTFRVGCLGLVLLVMAIPVCLPPLDKHKDINRQNLSQIGLCLALYASDHEGHFPKSLKELHPDYVPDEKLLEFTEPTTKMPCQWLYFAGFTQASPSDTIIASSRSYQVNGKGPNKRMVLRPQWTVEVIDDNDYIVQIQDQHRRQKSITASGTSNPK